MQKHVAIIGSGFSSLSAACFLGSEGFDVTVLEKNEQIGGRAGVWQKDGFTFDMGPSWYWMPDVFERFFNEFDYTTSDFYELKRLTPSYKVFYAAGIDETIPAEMSELKKLFDRYELGAGDKLESFLKEAEYKYNVGMKELVYRPGASPLELITKETMLGVFRLQVFSSFAKHIRYYFKHPFLLQLLEFPVLFLGAKPANTPALYSLMNYADMQLGTWYPMGGMSKITTAMQQIAKTYGVKFNLNEEVTELHVDQKNVIAISTAKRNYSPDVVLAGADYHHVEQKLLPEEFRSYSHKQWEQKTMAPSCLIYYIGVNKKLQNLLHHNLFFDTDFEKHSEEIYDQPQFPSSPLFYVCCPSQTDDSVAPEGCENLFILIPVASGLVDDEATKEKYFQLCLDRIEKRTQQKFAENIIVKRSYAYTDFVKDYHSFKGNAYGLANTLLQTAFLRPKMKSKKVNNLFFTGQLTVPGPGVPPALISGEVAANEILKHLKK